MTNNRAAMAQAGARIWGWTRVSRSGMTLMTSSRGAASPRPSHSSGCASCISRVSSSKRLRACSRVVPGWRRPTIVTQRLSRLLTFSSPRVSSSGTAMAGTQISLAQPPVMPL